MDARLRDLRSKVRQRRREIEAFTCCRLFPAVTVGRVRRTRHFREWWRAPMNYVRLMEIPIALELLRPRAGQQVLDIGSPKLLALHLMSRGLHVIASDIDDYFVNDFSVYRRHFGFPGRAMVADSRALPFADASFDSVFSVSVIEHIPDDGDVEALRDVRRVLKPDGHAVLTLPVATSYMEEWQPDARFYWSEASKTRDGSTFYQRRYDAQSLRRTVEAAGFCIAEAVYIAEHPIEPPRLSVDGRLHHNFHFIRKTTTARLTTALSRKLGVPLAEYACYRVHSARRHYLTRDANDPNVRQVALRLSRGPYTEVS